MDCLDNSPFKLDFSASDGFMNADADTSFGVGSDGSDKWDCDSFGGTPRTESPIDEDAFLADKPMNIEFHSENQKKEVDRSEKGVPMPRTPKKRKDGKSKSDEAPSSSDKTDSDDKTESEDDKTKSDEDDTETETESSIMDQIRRRREATQKFLESFDESGEKLMAVANSCSEKKNEDHQEFTKSLKTVQNACDMMTKLEKQYKNNLNDIKQLIFDAFKEV